MSKSGSRTIEALDSWLAPVEIRLPTSIGSPNIYSLFEICSRVAGSDSPVVLDASDVNWVDPFGLAVLGALLEPIRQTGRRISMPWMSRMQAGYLDRMDFFRRCPIDDVDIPTWGRNDQRHKLVELRCVDKLHETDETAALVAQAIAGYLTSADPEAPKNERGLNEYDGYFRPLQYSFCELLQNALTHAREEGRRQAAVWIAAQYYAQTDKVHVALVDNGCGMLATLKNHPKLQSRTHAGAILSALEPRVSCNRVPWRRLGEPMNQGVGLTTTNRIALAAGGRLAIVTGDAMHLSNSQVSRLMPEPAFWPGVAISFICKRSRLPSVNIGSLLPKDDLPPVSVRFR